MERRPEMWIPGLVLTGVGAAGAFVFLYSSVGTAGEAPGVQLVPLGITGLVATPIGLRLLIVGARKTWRGPEHDASPAVGVGPGSLQVRGAF